MRFTDPARTSGGADVLHVDHVERPAVAADEVLVAKNGVDGVYTADPNKDASATKIDEITCA